MNIIKYIKELKKIKEIKELKELKPNIFYNIYMDNNDGTFYITGKNNYGQLGSNIKNNDNLFSIPIMKFNSKYN